MVSFALPLPLYCPIKLLMVISILFTITPVYYPMMSIRYAKIRVKLKVKRESAMKKLGLHRFSVAFYSLSVVTPKPSTEFTNMIRTSQCGDSAEFSY